MDWNNIWENTISGIFVVAFGSIAGWILYLLGIKGKERSQIASQRKQEIYIPLKYELKNIVDMKNDIWKKISNETLDEIICKNDELVVDEDIYEKCLDVDNLINTYHSINLYTVSSNILIKRFEEKYLELYGSTTHIETRHLEDEDIEIDVTDDEIMDFSIIASNKNEIDKLLKNDISYEEYCQDEGYVSPGEEFFARMCATVLPKGEKKYNGVRFENVKNNSFKSRKISPAEYIAYGFNFLKQFNEDSKVKEKEQLLCEIKESSLDLFEKVTIQIRSIGNKYEKE